MTAKQKQNIARFKRVVAEAKKLRKKNPGLTQPQAVKQAWAILYKSGKKVGATKIIEKGEKKNAKVTKVLQRVRTKKGTFKGTKRVGNTNGEYYLQRVKDGFYLTYNLSSGKHSFIDSKEWGVLMTKTQAEQMKRKYENEGVNVRIVEYTKNPLKRVSGSSHKDTKSHNVNIRVVSGINKLSAGAKKLWLEINKKGFFKFNTEENILLFLYDEAIRKGQYKKAEYLRELYDNIKYY